MTLPPKRSLLLFVLTALVACGPAGPDDDDATEEEHDDHDHDHGTGDTDVHIHAVHHWGEHEIVLGTHDGLYRTSEGEDELVEIFGGPDFMGFVQSPHDADTYWASGHWGSAGMGNWGFAESTDGGDSWDEITLTGTVDFHQMAVSPDLQGGVLGRFSGSFYWSTDAGRTWETWTSPADVADMEIVDPDGPDVLVATPSGILLAEGETAATSSLLAGSFRAVDRWQDGYAVGTDGGDVLLCDASFADCDEIDGPSSDAVMHVLASDDHADEFYVLTVASEVFHTDDGGAAWELIAAEE